MVCDECPVDDDTPGHGRGGVSRSLNLYQSADNLYAWRKTRASLDPNADVVFYWSGYIYNVMPKDQRITHSVGALILGGPYCNSKVLTYPLHKTAHPTTSC